MPDLPDSREICQILGNFLESAMYLTSFANAKVLPEFAKSPA